MHGLGVDLGEARLRFDPCAADAMPEAHAHPDAIEFLRDKAERDGRIQPVHHARTRPIPVEREATHRATTLAEVAGVPVMIVHGTLDQTIAIGFGKALFDAAPEGTAWKALDGAGHNDLANYGIYAMATGFFGANLPLPPER